MYCSYWHCCEGRSRPVIQQQEGLMNLSQDQWLAAKKKRWRVLTVLLMLVLLWWQVKTSHVVTRRVSIQQGSLTVWIKARRFIVLTMVRHRCPPKSWPVESLAPTIWIIGISCHLLSCVEVCTVHINVLSEAETHLLSLSHSLSVYLAVCPPACLSDHVCLFISCSGRGCWL